MGTSEELVSSAPNSEPFRSLSFRLPFRKYQRMILAQTEATTGDNRYHIVAPPGSGKTILGLELIRRFGANAVVFAPTTIIQQQWRDQVALFTSSPADAVTLTSVDPAHLAPINIFTYQLISTPGEQQEFGRRAAIQRWVEELLVEGKVADETGAHDRLETLQRNDPDGYQREVSRHYLRVKADLLRAADASVDPFLHPNARKLIHDLLAHGVRTVVLDECHHLLDYWAIVLRRLIAQIPGARVVGLTATLPSPEDDEEYENYAALLGDVDFEVPTPAVVKEGDLAPYRDLAYFVIPSGPEDAYLHNIQDAFEQAIAGLVGSPNFTRWLQSTILERKGPDGGVVPWADFLDARPALAVAGLRLLRRIGAVLPPDLTIPVEAREDMTLEDWAAILEPYALDHLKLSAIPEERKQFAELRESLLPFGLTITEAGLRQGRSAGDLILALSESKGAAAADILAWEDTALGPRLRAVIVTDFERLATGVERLRGVLERDAGSAVRVFRQVMAHPVASTLNPILVTGRTVMIPSSQSREIADAINGLLASHGVHATCTLRTTPLPSIMEVVGEGHDWSPGTYVRIVTGLFDRGLTRCLVGTRGIFGEGWDTLSLNTLIDLTSVTTSASVQQLRGRTIRKDPTWPRKLAHNWDVVCVATGFKRGDSDLRRFRRRHDQYWGIVPQHDLDQDIADITAVLARQVLGPDMAGQVVKGVTHVDPDLALELATRRFDKVRYERYNRRMLRAVGQRDRSYDLWKIGEDYSNFAFSAARLETTDLKIRTVYTISETLRRMLREFRASMLTGIFLSLYLALRLSPAFGGSSLQVIQGFGILLGGGFLLTFGWNSRAAYRLARKFLAEQPADAILLDVGRALLSALQTAGLVSRNLQADFVRVVEQPDNSYRVLLDYASPADSAKFVRAYREVFEPVRDQRYLILRTDSRLPQLRLRPFWFVLRRWYRRRWGYRATYHPVPAVLAARKETAEAFAESWSRYVGGGTLVFTRNEEGRQALLRARAQRRPNVPGLAFEVWR